MPCTISANPYERNGKYPQFSPINHIATVKTLTLILHGEKDGDVPVSQGLELFRAVKDHGIESAMVLYPWEPPAGTETAHGKDQVARVCDWFARYLRA